MSEEDKILQEATVGHIGLIRPIRLIGLIGLIGLITTSCRNSKEEIEPDPEVSTEVAISFSGQEGEEQNVTRAGQPLSELGITRFTVYGYKNDAYEEPNYTSYQTVFPGFTVNYGANTAYTTTSNTDNWEYVGVTADQTIKYWDWGAMAYRYFGYALGAGESPVSVSAGSVTGSGNAVTQKLSTDGSIDASTAEGIANAPYFTRMWFSTGNVTLYPDKEFGKPVQLEFMKPFARVRFIFIYSYPREGILLEDKCFKPTTDFDEDPDNDAGIPRKGTVSITYPLTGPEPIVSATAAKDESDAKLLDAFTVDADPEDDGKVYPADVPEGWYTVLPNMSQGSYTLSVKINKGVTPRTCVVPEEYMQWLPGYSYTYKFKITDEGGVEIDLVESAFTPWTEYEDSHSVYNW